MVESFLLGAIFAALVVLISEVRKLVHMHMLDRMEKELRK